MDQQRTDKIHTAWERSNRKNGGVIFIKESIQAYEIKLEKEADCVKPFGLVTIGLVYRNLNIDEEDNTNIYTIRYKISG